MTMNHYRPSARKQPPRKIPDWMRIGLGCFFALLAAAVVLCPVDSGAVLAEYRGKLAGLFGSISAVLVVGPLLKLIAPVLKALGNISD